MKNINYKFLIWIILIISALVLGTIAYVKGIKILGTWALLKQLPNVAFIDGILFLIFAKWGWRIKLLQGWLVPFPDLNGTWQGEIQTTWKDPKTNETPGPIPVILSIKQTFLGINCLMITKEMRSCSFAESFRIEQQTKQLVYSYISKPTTNVSARSTMHEGTIIFNIIGNPVNKLQGQYWTSRQTNGSIHLTFKEKKLSDQLPADFSTHPMSDDYPEK